MKTRKKTAVFALLLAVCLLLGACSSTDIKKQNAYELVKNAVEKTSKLDSYELDMTTNTTIDMMGQKMSTPINFNIKAEGAGSSLKAIGTISMSVLGLEVKGDVYQENNMIYLSLGGMKFKIDASAEEAKTYQFADTEEQLIKSLPEDVLKDVQVTDNADGSRSVSVTVDGEKFTGIYNELVSALSNADSYSEYAKDIKTEITVKDAKVDINVLPNGYIGKYELAFDMDIKISSASEGLDVSSSVGVEASASFKDPGSKVTVTAPSDLSEYVDYSKIPGMTF
ncbi:MAG: hypothetical protein IJM39_07995 [Firmicutes bacterium]|nr:hypothetical protein [Bacillota bacterium]